MKVKNQYLIVILLIGLLPLLATLALFFVNTRPMIESRETDYLITNQKMLKSSVNETLELVKQQGAILAGKSNVADLLRDKSNVEKRVMVEDDFAKVLKLSNMYDVLGVVDSTGKIIADGSHTLLGQDVSDLAYFKDTMSSRIVHISAPKKSISTDKGVIVIATPIIENNTVLGVLIQSVSLDILSEKSVRDSKIGATGYLYVVTQDGTMVLHPKTEEILEKNILKIPESKTMLSEGEGTLNYEYNGAKKVVHYSKDNNTGWVYIAVINQEETTAVETATSKNTFYLIGALLVLLTLVGLKLAARAAKPLIKMTEVVGKIAEKDLTVSMSDKSTLETATMSNALNSATLTLMTMINGIKKSSAQMFSTSKFLSQNTESMTKISKNVNIAVDEISQGTVAQAQDLMDITNDLNSFSITLKDMARDAEIINSSFKSAESKALSGSEDVTNLVNIIAKVGQEFKTVSGELDALVAAIANVDSITGVITGISEQTNLLALNAAIEAARAGESGRGFSVVAEEIRKLAEQSKDSATEIRVMLAGISKRAIVVNSSSNSVGELLIEQSSIVETSTQSFQQITEAIDTIAPLLSSLSNEIVNIVDKNVEITGKVETVSSVAEETSASTEEITAAVQEITASLEEIAEMAAESETIASNIDDQLNEFNTVKQEEEEKQE